MSDLRKRIDVLETQNKEFEKRKTKKKEENLQIDIPYKYVPSTSGANTRFDKCKWIGALRQGGNAI